MKSLPFTLDVVVAANLRRLRHQRDRMTRVELALELSRILGRPVSSWRIRDLEGARSADQVPRPVTWTELVALTQALGSTIYELTLPPPPHEQDAPFGDGPDQIDPSSPVVPFGWDLEQTDSATGASVRVGAGLNREQLFESIYSLPANVLDAPREDIEKQLTEGDRLERRLRSIEAVLLDGGAWSRHNEATSDG